MKTCKKCGAPIPQNSLFCPSCGNAESKTAESQKESETAQKVEEAFTEWNDTSDYTRNYIAEDIEKGKVLSILSYFSILVLIPIFLAKDSPYTRFHANQGLILFIAEAAYGIATRILVALLSLFLPPIIPFLFDKLFMLLSLLFVVFAILGMINVINGKAKELPVFGTIRILK